MKYTRTLILLFVAFTGSSLSQKPNMAVVWSAFDAGYARTGIGTETIIQSVVGQVFVGQSQEGNSVIQHGFLADTALRQQQYVVGVNDDGLNTLPVRFSLAQNYPNPFNPTTTIRYDLPRASKVSLRLYNILGQEVAILVNGEEKEAGVHVVHFDASRLPSGVYFYRMQAGSFNDVKKLGLVK